MAHSVPQRGAGEPLRSGSRSFSSQNVQCEGFESQNQSYVHFKMPFESSNLPSSYYVYHHYYDYYDYYDYYYDYHYYYQGLGQLKTGCNAAPPLPLVLASKRVGMAHFVKSPLVTACLVNRSLTGSGGNFLPLTQLRSCSSSGWERSHPRARPSKTGLIPPGKNDLRNRSRSLSRARTQRPISMPRLFLCQDPLRRKTPGGPLIFEGLAPRK